MRPLTTLFAGLLALSLAACGPEGTANIALDLRFAQLEQAQTGEGLPPDLLSLEVLAWNGQGTDTVGGSDCISLRANDPKRQALSLDINVGMDLMIEFRGWPNATCGGETGWRGSAYGVDVLEGKETTVSLFVTRQGTRLNPIHQPLPSPRAFATATALRQGQVLIAGGFDRIDGTTLEAACTALIYDLGAGAVTRTVPMQACRGLHQAIALDDGRVVLMGGTSRATFDPQGASRPMLRPEVDALLASAEIYDPATGDFSVETDPDLGRALAAAALTPSGKVFLAGGRTIDQIRSAQVIGGTPAGEGFTWQATGSGLGTPRSGALAVALGSDVLIVGGNQAGDDVEVLVNEGPSVEPVQLIGDTVGSLARAGHTLSVPDALGSRLALAGGTPTQSGQAPQSDLLWATWQPDQEQLSISVQSMAKSRAYHAAGWLGGEQGDARLVLVGGLSAALDSNPDLELAQLSGGGQLLADPLTTGAVGVALARLPDGSLLLAGGLDVDGDTMSLSAAGVVLTP